MNGQFDLLATAEGSETSETETSSDTQTDQTDSGSPSDSGSDSSGGGGSSFPSEITVANLDPVEYQTISLESGDFRLLQQVTLGDILVCFCILLVVVVQIAKWKWEASK